LTPSSPSVETRSSSGVIETFSTIRVLSTDDVAFRLNGNDSSSEVVQQQQASGDGPSICVTLTNTSGLLFITFLCIIIVSVITSAILGCRRRKSGKKVAAAEVLTTSTKMTMTSKEDSKLSSMGTSFVAPIPQKLPPADSPCKKLKK
jgi:hypothetical protein